MRCKFRRVTVALAALAGATELAAAAERLDEVVVTASRRDLPAERIHFATATVDLAGVDRPLVVTDRFAELAGVALQQTTPGQGAAIVRGQRGSSVLHLVDGIRLNNAIFRSAPTQYFALVPVAAAERLEVVRGTPTALYGSDAVGGVVQLVSYRPTFETDRVSTSGLTELVADTATLRRGVRSRVDIGRRGLAASLSGEYVDVGNRRTGSGERVGSSGLTTRGGRFWLGAERSDTERWSLDLQYGEQPSTPRVDELVAGFGQSEAASDEFFFEPNRRSFAHLRYEHDALWLGADLGISLAGQRIDDDRRTRDRGAATRRSENNRSDLVGLTASLARTAGAGSWVAGLEHYRDTVHSARADLDLTTGSALAIEPRFPDGAVLSQSALFVSGERLLAERHRLSGGLRLSHIDIDIPAGVAVDAKTLSITDPSGDIGYLFALTPTLDLVVNAGAGFRAPNVFDLGTLGERPGNRFNEPNTNLTSESVFSIDAGIRWRSEQFSGELLLYRLDYTDRIVSVPTGALTASGRQVVRAQNLADSVVTGIEAALDWQLSDTWTLAANAFYTRGEQSTFDGPDEPGDRIPPLEGRVRLRYAPGEHWYIVLGATAARGQHRLSARDRDDPRIDPAGTPGWAVLDVSLHYRSRTGWQLGVEAGNLTDRHYRRHGSGIAAPGRNLSVGWRYVW